MLSQLRSKYRSICVFCIMIVASLASIASTPVSEFPITRRTSPIHIKLTQDNPVRTFVLKVKTSAKTNVLDDITSVAILAGYRFESASGNKSETVSVELDIQSYRPKEGTDSCEPPLNRTPNNDTGTLLSPNMATAKASSTTYVDTEKEFTVCAVVTLILKSENAAKGELNWNITHVAFANDEVENGNAVYVSHTYFEWI